MSMQPPLALRGGEPWFAQRPSGPWPLRAGAVAAFAALLIFATPVAAAAAAVETNAGYWQGFARVPLRIVGAPLTWRTRDWLRNGAVGLAAGALVFADEPIRDAIQGGRGPATDAIAGIGTGAGGGLEELALIGGMEAAGLASGQPRLRQAALLGLQAVTVAGLFSEGVKRLAQRDRPQRGRGARSWSGPGLTSDTSFPSGHATRAFALASVIASEFSDIPAAPVVAYGLAGLAGLARLNDDAHWASDVVFGAALGWGIGHLVVATSPFRSHGVRLSLARPGGGIGVAGRIGF